jgi:CHASE3 domain sensor protein
MMLAQSGGGPQNEAAVRKAVQAMRGMSDSQVEMMAKAAATLSSGAAKLRAAREWMASRAFLVAAVVVLLVAVLLRWLGIM